MALPAPNLDDRRYPDLVAEAVRMVQQRCPEWTDHNASDPGITLIEAFAFMTDQFLYRLNRVPDRLYVKFLDLLGLRMFPPTPARAPVTFWLSTPATTPLTIPAGTDVGTLRTETVESIVFTLEENLSIVPCSLQHVLVQPTADETNDVTNRLESSAAFPAFGAVPQVGDRMLVGVDDAVPNCAVRLDFEGAIEGVGVNPQHPPLVWEAWNGQEWVRCLVSSDETGGLNRSGSLVVHVPSDHVAAVLHGTRAGWLSARVTEPIEGQPPYSDSPIVRGLGACTIGGTGAAINAELVVNEVLGESEGVAGQVLKVAMRPVLAGVGDVVVEVSSDDGWQEWLPVDNFAQSGPADRHFVLDAHAGEITFGPVVRMPDGSVRNYGAVPEKRATIRVKRYAVGGGSRGNVAAGAIRTLKSSIPFVSAVENLFSAHGGVDGESLEEAKRRGPLLLHTRHRAVTAEDYEVLAHEAAPDVARVRCLTASEDDSEPGLVRVLVVPAAAAGEQGVIDFGDLVPPDDLLARIANRLDEVRLVGARVVVEPPRYRGVTVVARLIARPRVSADRVREEALASLYRFLSPLSGGGHDGKGWPFGRSIQSGDLFAVLAQVRGVEMIEDVRLFAANPVTGERGKEAKRIVLEPNSLIFSFEHKVRVEER